MILPIVILVLGVVLIWWMWIWPRTPQFKTYKRKTEIRAQLYNIEPPQGVQVIKVEVLDSPASKSTNRFVAVGTYLGVLDCDAVIAHYKEQFPKQGFTLTEEKEDPQEHDKRLSFSAPGYSASLGCTRRDLPQLYSIVMWTTA
jgi:hypothetical protein